MRISWLNVTSLNFPVVFNWPLIWDGFWILWKFDQTLNSTPGESLFFSDCGSPSFLGLDLLVPQWKRTKHQRAPPAWALGDFGAETVYMNDANSISPISEVNQWKDSVRSLKHYKNNPLQVSLGD